ncbi:MAG: hypothetical protein KDI01_00425 [Halioglobus sp.]|nr:hypothetical protein [Halioglobus sp.]
MLQKSHRTLSLRPLAIWLLPLLAAVALLILVFGDKRDVSSALEIVATTAQGVTLAMESSGDEPADASAGTSEYVPPAEARRQAVLSRLSEFRATYKQARPFVTVAADGSVDSLRQLAQRLADALGKYGLGRVELVPPGQLPDAPAALPVLRCAERDAAIARELLAALEPYLGGGLEMAWDERLRVDQMYLELRGTPSFSAQGEAFFGADYAPVAVPAAPMENKEHG